MSIQLTDISKTYGIQKAVNSISFSAKKGEIVGFLGPNGAGKSTTMKILTGFIQPTEGAVLVNGIDVIVNPIEAQKSIGYLPEHNPLYLEMAIIDYLGFCAGLQGVSKSNIPQRIEEMIKLCGLTRERHKNIGELSKGYRQRVGLAQAMIHDPEILILDEPTTGLHFHDIQQLLTVLHRLRDHGNTVVVIEHNLDVVKTADWILDLGPEGGQGGGEIVAEGTPEDVALVEGSHTARFLKPMLNLK